MLFWEQGITITSILMAIGITISVLVDALLPSRGGGTSDGKVRKPPPKDKKGEWRRNKLKTFSSLLGRLEVKVEEALPDIIGAILRWILNKAANVVGWVSQNLWALVVGIEGLLYT